MVRRQQAADRAARPKLRSPGHTKFQRQVEAAFWTEIGKGLLPIEAAAVVGVSQPVGHPRWWCAPTHNLVSVALSTLTQPRQGPSRGQAVRVTSFRVRLNRPGFHGGSQPTEDESHGCTEEVPGRAA